MACNLSSAVTLTIPTEAFYFRRESRTGPGPVGFVESGGPFGAGSGWGFLGFVNGVGPDGKALRNSAPASVDIRSVNAEIAARIATSFNCTSESGGGSGNVRITFTQSASTAHNGELVSSVILISSSSFNDLAAAGMPSHAAGRTRYKRWNQHVPLQPEGQHGVGCVRQSTQLLKHTWRSAQHRFAWAAQNPGMLRYSGLHGGQIILAHSSQQMPAGNTCPAKTARVATD